MPKTPYQTISHLGSSRFIKEFLDLSSSSAIKIIAGSTIPKTERGKRLAKARVLKYLHFARKRIDEMIRENE